MFVIYDSLYFAAERQHQRLLDMLAGRHLDARNGICYNLACGCLPLGQSGWSKLYADYWKTEQLRTGLVRMWEWFSGVNEYPVPADKGSKLSAMDAFHTAVEYGTHWDTSTEYGALRYNLLCYLQEGYRSFLQETIKPHYLATINCYHDNGFGELIAVTSEGA